MSNSTDLRDIQKAVWRTAEEHGWHKDDDNIPVKLVMIHSEVSEALEEYRNTPPESEVSDLYYNGLSDKPEGFGVELADVVIRVLDLAEMLDIDLTGIILTKMKYNESRPYRHGGKRV